MTIELNHMIVPARDKEESASGHLLELLTRDQPVELHSRPDG